MRLDAHSLVPRPCVYRSRLLCVAAQALLRTAYFEDGMACHAAAAATSGFGASLARCAVSDVHRRICATDRPRCNDYTSKGPARAGGRLPHCCGNGCRWATLLRNMVVLSMVNIGAWHGWHAGEARNGTATCTACAATRSTSLRRAS
jgi:hypothetical protein